MKTYSNNIRIPEPLELPFVTVKFLQPPTPRTMTDVDCIPHTSVVMFDNVAERHVIFYMQYEIKDRDVKRMDRNTVRRYFYNSIINQIMQANTLVNNGRAFPLVVLPPSPRMARQAKQNQETSSSSKDNVDDADSIWNSLIRMVEYQNDKEGKQCTLFVNTAGSEPTYNLKLNLGNYLTFTAFRNDPSSQRHREMMTSACSGTCTVLGKSSYNFAIRSLLWWERGVNKLCGMLDHDQLQTRIYDVLDGNFYDLMPNTSLMLTDLKFNNQE